MTGYSIGLMKFLDEIVLLKKARPEWQRGLLNLPGGKIEEGEHPRQCMAREWQEETGVFTYESDWKQKLTIIGKEYTLYVFTTFPPDRCELKFTA
jgi:8-oxo-dGTP pyrophosphatase MutT (NUDIX family)